MPFAIIRHKVRDYAAWRRIYDADAERREVEGQGAWVMVSEKDPSDVAVIIHVNRLEDAKRFMFDELGPKMREAGVAEPPRIEFFEDAPPVG
ncbi:MAG: hypothetical protein AAGH15_10055 [Myxococcota bacterium]